VTYGQMLAVNASVPAKSIAELVQLAKQKPLNYASGGNGSPSHLSFAYFLAASGIDMRHIPYKGTGQSIVDVVAGQVDSIFAVTTGVYPHVKSGKLRALGVSSLKRSEVAPEVPTVAESGFQGFDASFAYVLLAPARTPEELVQVLAREVKNAMAAPDVQERNRLADYSPTGLDARQSAAWLADKRAHWAAWSSAPGSSRNDAQASPVARAARRRRAAPLDPHQPEKARRPADRGPPLRGARRLAHPDPRGPALARRRRPRGRAAAARRIGRRGLAGSRA
jgi:tripartite-type tricarboxylate transporter receptor subunit TctC